MLGWEGMAGGTENVGLGRITWGGLRMLDWEGLPGGTEKLSKTLRIVGALSEIRTGHLLCTGEKHFSLSQLVRYSYACKKKSKAIQHCLYNRLRWR
jgi:hypothetical protein